MRTARWAIGLAVLGLLLPHAAHGQGMAGGMGPYGDGAASTSSLDDGDLALGPSVAPAPPTRAAVPYAPSTSGAAPQSAAKPPSAPEAQATTPVLVDPGTPGDPAAPAPWHLPQPYLFQRLGITWGGWNQMGATINNWSPPSHFNGPLATNDRNEFELNQLWLFFDRPVNTATRGWDWGGHVDLVYGTDWRFGRNFGLENKIDSPNCLYGMVLPQFYFSAGVGYLTVKMGHYTLNFGYENVPAPGNFFYSHSYAMGYLEPILVTGVEADYKLTDQMTLTGGFNRGWMMFEDMNTSLDIVAGVRWESEDKLTKVSFMTTNGPQDPANAFNRFAYALVLQEQITEKFLYVIQNDLGVEDGTSNLVPGTQARWYDINQYFFYQFNPEWRGCVRFEWLRDADGTRIAGVGGWIGSDRGWTGKPGFAGDFYELTVGLNWRFHPNCVLRPEVRWDWYGGTRNLDAQLPFGDGDKARMFTAACDLLVTF